MNYIVPFAVTGGVLAMLLVAAILPWMVVNFQGNFSFTLFDVIRSYLDRSSTSALDFQRGDFSSLVQNIYTYAAFLASVLFYLMSIAFIGISIPNAHQKKTFLSTGAVFAIISVAAWIYGTETMKMQIIEDPNSSGPLAQLASGFIGSTIMTGIGPYLICAAGISALIFSFLKEIPEKPEIRQKVQGELTGNEKNVLDVSAKSDKKVILDDLEARNPAIDRSANINRIVYKSSGTAALIAFLGAIFGLPGIGHIYVGRIGRGLLILFAGFTLYVLSWLTFLGGLFGGAIGRSIPVMQAGTGLGIALMLMYFGLLIWQTFNARTLAKKLNEQIQLTGKEPW